MFPDESRPIMFSIGFDPKVSIIILNYNSWKDTIECLESIYQMKYAKYDVIVVDNSSEDRSVEMINAYCKGIVKVSSNFLSYNSGNKPIKVLEYTRYQAEVGGRECEIADLPSNRKLILIKNERNYGFAEGNNIAIRYALKRLNPDYVLLLNNDVVVDRELLTELIKVVKTSSKIGIVGPTIFYYDNPELVNFAGEDLILWKAKGIRYTTRPTVPKDVDMINGACMLIKKEVIKDVGLFYPNFFVYWEETDYCVRVKKKGYRIVYVPKAKIWHKIASSIEGEYSYWRIYYLTRNRFLFVKRNCNRLERTRFLIYFFYWDLWLTIGSFLKKNHFKVLPAFIKGVYHGLRTFCTEIASDNKT